MAKRQKKFEQDHSNDWLNTYADMVTLLLTFFVMLYASSSLDDQKWQFIYQAFQSHGKYLNEYIDSLDPNSTEGNGVTDDTPQGQGGSGELPQSFDQLYVYLSQYVSENNLEQSVAVEQGAAHITIKFDDGVFFDPDSAVLRSEGKEVLKGISPGIKAAAGCIQTLTVSGHTAQGFSAVNDFALSANRAVSVENYLEFNAVLPTEKFRVKGCGPTEPIADNSTPEGKAKNRRVEIMLLKSDLDFTDPATLQDIFEHDFGIYSDKFDPDAPQNDDDISKLPDGSVDKIIQNIESMFPGSSSIIDVPEGPEIFGNTDSFIFDSGGDAGGSAEGSE
ncbi:MAG: flagellar motor protein MotB [Oscillospiraceae bacterium]